MQGTTELVLSLYGGKEPYTFVACTGEKKKDKLSANVQTLRARGALEGRAVSGKNCRGFLLAA